MHTESGKDFDDSLYAKIKYEENGSIIYNTLNDTSKASKYIIEGSFFRTSNMKKMGLVYNEPTDIEFERITAKGIISPSLDIEYMPCTTIGCSAQLKWDIIFYKNVGSTAPNPFKIPLSLILAKQ